MNQYLQMNQLHLLQHCDSELHPNINGLFMIKCSMIMITKINIFRGVSFTTTNYRSEWYWYTAQSRIYIATGVWNNNNKHVA